jgi:hypothetical protein
LSRGKKPAPTAGVKFDSTEKGNKKMVTVINAFTPAMMSLTEGVEGRLSRTTRHVSFDRVSVEYARQMVRRGCRSAVGHADTAARISSILGVEVPMNRVSLSVGDEGGEFLLAQYMGPRLPEGCTTLPEGAELRFILVSIYSTEDEARRIELYMHS